MLTSDQRREYISKIKQLPVIIEKAVASLNDSQLDTPYGEGKWTVRQVVHHLADSHMNAFIRMKLVLTENHPTLKAYEQDDWAKTPDAHKLPVASSLAILKGLHERMNALLSSASEDDFRRTAFHPENGEMTLDDLVAIYGKHGEKHVESIIALRGRKGW